MTMAFKDDFLRVFWEVKDYTIKCKFNVRGYKDWIYNFLVCEI